ncbi:hypothetical protein BB561_003331 [Smittium simulii]|uniref:Protein kinase domain-containing protein n=1 Tax=Smittium simulii TaxID=133385 RepID=A0A2T9YLZ1_9FUNG|nr:hypothetical protein BB561_003331 [Smittium simulii]
MLQIGLKNTSQPIDAFKKQNNDFVFVFNRLEPLDISCRDLCDITYIIYQLLTLLKNLHQNNILHLDVNPSNLMIKPGSESELILIDFGLAHDLSACDSLPRRGTPGFIAPELLENAYYDGKVDVYSVGVVFGMMLLEFFPTIDLRLLGSPNVTSETIDTIISQIDEFFSLFDYDPVNIVFPKSHYFSDSATPNSINIPSAQMSQSTSRTNNEDDDDLFINSFYQNNATFKQLYSHDAEDMSKSYGLASSFSSVNRFPYYNTNSSIYSGLRAQNSYKQNKNLGELAPLAVLHAADLLKLLLKQNPQERPTAQEALSHPLFSVFRESETTSNNIHRMASTSSFSFHNKNPKIINQNNFFSKNSKKDSKRAEFFKNTKFADINIWCDRVSTCISESFNNTRTASPMQIYHNCWE